MMRGWQLVVVALAFLVAGCEEEVLGLTCREVGAECSGSKPATGRMRPTYVSRCNYWQSSGRFEVDFRENEDRLYGVLVGIANFTGRGTYTTSADGATKVWIQTEGPEEEMVEGDSAGDPPTIPEHRCTIDVTSNLADLVIPPGGEIDTLNVDLVVHCPNGLGWGAICVMECTLNPPDFPLSVVGCIASE